MKQGLPLFGLDLGRDSDGWSVASQALKNARPARLDRPPVWHMPGQLSREATQHFEFKAVLMLEDFDRFAFAMYVPEHYSDNDCAPLLGCALRDTEEARTWGSEIDRLAPHASFERSQF